MSQIIVTEYTLVFSLIQDHILLFILRLLGSKTVYQGFPGGAVVKNPPASAGDTGSSPGPGRSHMPRSN